MTGKCIWEKKMKRSFAISPEGFMVTIFPDTASMKMKFKISLGGHWKKIIMSHNTSHMLFWCKIESFMPKMSKVYYVTIQELSSLKMTLRKCIAGLFTIKTYILSLMKFQLKSSMTKNHTKRVRRNSLLRDGVLLKASSIELRIEFLMNFRLLF